MARRLAALWLCSVLVTACMPKQFYAPYAAYLAERPKTPDEAKSRIDETGERFCGDLEREANGWSTAHSADTVGLGVLAAVAAVIGSALIVQAAGTTSSATVDTPKHNAGLVLQGAGVLLGGLATFSGLRGVAASRAAAEAGDSAAKANSSDMSRYQRCRAVLASWEDRREFITEVNAQRPGLTEASNKFKAAMVALETEVAADAGVSQATLDDALKAKDKLLQAVEP